MQTELATEDRNQRFSKLKKRVARRVHKRKKPRPTPSAEEILANGRQAVAEFSSNPVVPVGRPSVYRPELGELVMRLGAEGKSRVGIAAALHVDRATLDKWAAQYPDFGEALARAKGYEQEWWEQKGQGSLDNQHFQSQVWRTSMAARFKDDYAEQRQQTNGGFDLSIFVQGIGAAVQITAAPQRQLAAVAPGDAARAVDPLDVVLEQPNNEVDLANLLE